MDIYYEIMFMSYRNWLCSADAFQAQRNRHRWTEFIVQNLSSYFY